MKIKRGFTLIELLVVVTLFAIAAVGGSGMFISLIKNNQKSEALLKMKREGDTALNAIEREITWAKKIYSSTDVATPSSFNCAATAPANSDFNSPVIVRFMNVEDAIVKLYCSSGGVDGSGDTLEVNDLPLVSFQESGTFVKSCQATCSYQNGKYNLQFSFTLANTAAADQPFSIQQPFSINQTLRNSQP